jgi:hypothetical protein
MVNVTFVKALTMDAPVVYIGKVGLSYTSILLWGLFALIIFIAFAVWVYTYRRG